MTRETVRALSDADLAQVCIWGREETQERTSRRKQETIGKIRALAADAGVLIKIGGTRGRTPKVLMEQTAVRRKRNTAV
jgi:hypothetical protein